jgi:hypothetical protein
MIWSGLPAALDFDGGDVLIYALVDPGDNTVRYIGKTNDRARRLEQHSSGGRGGRELRRWLDSLVASGRTPRMMTLAKPIRARWGAAERAWIAWFEREGWRLYNVLPGGESSRRLRLESKRQAYRERRARLKARSPKPSPTLASPPPIRGKRRPIDRSIEKRLAAEACAAILIKRPPKFDDG